MGFFNHRKSIAICVGLVAIAPLLALGQEPQFAPPVPQGDARADAPTQEKLYRLWANEPPLVRLARERFGESLTETDAKFFAAVAANEWADFRPSPDAKYDVTDLGSWDNSPELKADRIEWLCTNPAAARLVPSHGVWLRGALVKGKINLYRYTVPFSLTFYDCLLDDGMYLANSKLQELDIRNSCSAAISAREVSVNENIYLIGTAVFGGAIFSGAQVAGDFDFTGGLAFHGRTEDDIEKPGVALELYDAKVGGDILLCDEFRAFGQVVLRGAQIGRSLNCNGGHFTSVGQLAINAHGSQVGASAKFSTGCIARGGINVTRMRVGGDLDCDGGRFIASGVDAVSADLVDVGGQVLLGDGFYAEGEVRLINATIAGNVDCDNGTFHHPEGDALSLDGAAIGRGLHIGTDFGAEAIGDDDGNTSSPHFVARGTVRLLGTRIASDLFSDGGEFDAPEGTAILANNVRIGSRAVLTNITAAGTIDLSSAQIEHELDLRGSHIDGRQTYYGLALVCNGMIVRGHLYTNYSIGEETLLPFRVDGQMSVQFATIGMHWDLGGAEIVNPTGTALDASDTRVGGYINLDTISIDGRASFSRAKIEGMWVMLNTRRPERMTLDLRFAHIWVIKDGRIDDWPPAGQLQLEGLVYDHFDDDSPLDVEDRLTWLARQYHSPAAPRTLPTAGTWPARPVVALAAFQDVADEGSSDSDSGPSAMMAPVGVIPSGDNSGESTPPQEFEPGEAEAAPLAIDVPSDEPPDEQSEDPAARRYVTQPYTQLASVYRAIGQDEQANRVLVARAERLGELSSAFSAHGIWYRYFGRLIGYGYEPFRAVKIGIVIVLLGSVVFAIGNRRHLMAETKLAEHVLSQEGEPRLISPTYPRFNPLVYSLDVFLPFVDLQQICYWLPGENMAGPRTSRNCLLHLGPWSLKWSALLRAYLWFQTLAGWTLCTLLAAAVTGIVKS